jgi:glucose dehydrogenase
VVHDGKRIDAVAQTTKTGYLYLFDRLTGEPLFPIEEHSYPASTVPGEVDIADTTETSQALHLMSRQFADGRDVDQPDA